MINLTNVKHDKNIGLCSFDEISQTGPIVLALGMFDGIHLGHRKLLDETVRLANKHNACPTMATFVNHPQEIINPNRIPKLITTTREKSMIACDCGIKQIILLWFDDSFAVLSPQKFIESYIMSLNVKAVVCGYNYCFGKKASGNAYMLKSELEKNDIEVSIIEKTDIDNVPVSSTYIRNLIENGNIELANKFLGYEYVISGNVVHGFERGRTIGFPTANICANSEKCMPPNGVYATKTTIDSKEYISVTNIGKNPTFGNENATIETYIMNFSENIYDKYITVSFYKMLRGENRFSSVNELAKVIENDKMNTISFFEDMYTKKA